MSEKIVIPNEFTSNIKEESELFIEFIKLLKKSIELKADLYGLSTNPIILRILAKYCKYHAEIEDIHLFKNILSRYIIVFTQFKNRNALKPISRILMEINHYLFGFLQMFDIKENKIRIDKITFLRNSEKSLLNMTFMFGEIDRLSLYLLSHDEIEEDLNIKIVSIDYFSDIAKFDVNDIYLFCQCLKIQDLMYIDNVIVNKIQSSINKCISYLLDNKKDFAIQSYHKLRGLFKVLHFKFNFFCFSENVFNEYFNVLISIESELLNSNC